MKAGTLVATGIDAKTMARRLSLVDAVRLLLWLVALSGAVQAQSALGDFDYTIEGGKVTIVEYIGLGGAVAIPGEIDRLPVTSIGDWAFASCGDSLTSVTIPDSVTSIGYSAFELCTGLTSVVMGNHVSSIGDYAFLGCTGLTSVTIPDSVTDLGLSAFESCTGLTRVVIGSRVSSIGDYTFFECRGLTSVTVPNSVTSLGPSAFEGCSGLTSVVIGNQVSSLGDYAFADCINLNGAYFQGNAPSVGLGVFEGDNRVIIYYLPGKTGWGATLDSRPTELLASPAIAGLNPTYGPAAGGTRVTITGAGLIGATAVKFGTRAASSFTVNSATQITATAPGGSAGQKVDVSITTPGGVSANTAADDYTYNNLTAKQFVFAGRIYELVTTKATWTQAQALAAAATLNGRKGHLAVIESAAENTAVYEGMDSIADLDVLMPWATYKHPDSGARGVWLGASDSGASIPGASEGNFYWLAHGVTAAAKFWQDGMPPPYGSGQAAVGAYANWGSGAGGAEPDDWWGSTSGAQNHVAMQIDSWPLGLPGQWNDLNGAVAQAYLIEYEDPTDGLVITWANPAAIVYGTALSATQLNARANVPGQFVYSPAAGTKPAVGTLSLGVTFTPTDTTRYAVTPKTVTLVVNKAACTVTFKSLPLKASGDADFSPGASASSGLPVLYSSSNPAVAEIVDGRVHVVGAGTAVITASQPESANYKAAGAVKQTLTVKARIAAEVPTGGGSVSGVGLYAPGAKATLTAKPDKLYAFLHWEDGSQVATRTLVVPNAGAVVTAYFQTVATIVRATVTNPVPQPAMVGVPFSLPLEIHSDCLPTVTVTGLPAGLKYNAATRTIAGVPTAATPAGKPAQVKVSVSNVANAKTPDSIIFTLTVNSLPPWAVGTFNGWATGTDAAAPAAATMTVTVQGQVSGKFTAGGKTYAFSATAFTRRDLDGSFWIGPIRANAGTSILEVDLRVSQPTYTGAAPAPPALGLVEGWQHDGGGRAGASLSMYRGVWKDTGMATVVKTYEGYYTATLPGAGDYGSGYLAFTVDTAGIVKTAGKLADGTGVSLSSVLILDAGGRVWTVLYTAPSAYKGGAFSGLVEFSKPVGVGASVIVRVLGGNAFFWESLNPTATAEYEGFLRRLWISGGQYSKIDDLRARYVDGLEVGEVGALPAITVTVRITEADPNYEGEADPPPTVSYPESREVDPVSCSPGGLALIITPATGIGTGFAAPRATPPVWDRDSEEYLYAGANPTSLTISFARATGLFSGSFKVWYDYNSAENSVTNKNTVAHVSTTASFQGILTPVRAGADGSEGGGFFLWGAKGSYENDAGKAISFAFNYSYDFRILAP